MNRDEVFKAIEDNKEKIKAYGVKELGLFGSCVRGEEGSESDLDFLVELEEKTFDAYMDLKIFLEELFSCRVDLVLTDAIKPRLRTSILKEVAYATGL
ncbi:MAG: nucleotidyltransferase family protein [Deltaproteobacteria bacterium]|nr:nucleotidyltransferase family protein [Deltaproteobacteria bacterium]